jgi:hypothetical protein
VTPEDVLRELLARIGASLGEPVLVSDTELGRWPEIAVRAMKTAGLLTRAAPASAVTCPGCEEQCSIEVHSHSTSGEASFFVVCDKRPDINRVPIPEEALVQWNATAPAIAAWVARLLNITYASASSGQRCEVGLLRGRQHSAHVVLVADGTLRLKLAGHEVLLADLLTLKGTALRLDLPWVLRLINAPRSTADVESPQQRKQRLLNQVAVEKRKGNRAPQKTVAKMEGISVTRLKQIFSTPSKRSAKLTPSSKYRNRQY